MLITTFFSEPVLFLRIVIIVIISVTLHELAHGWTALTQGDDTPKRSGHMTANPIVHMGWESIIFLCLAGFAWGQMPVNPSRFRNPKWGNIWVSAAGPLLNLVLGLLFIILLNLELSILPMPILSTAFLRIGAYINLSLFLFNMLPIPPLDGFHVCCQFIPELKILEDNQFGLFTLAILFTTGFFPAIGMVANVVICLAVPSLQSCQNIW